MALTKEIVVDKIEVLEMGNVQVRTATKVLENGEVLSRSFHRHVLSPCFKDNGSCPPRARRICHPGGHLTLL